MFLDYLKTEPRSQDIPSWQAVGSFSTKADEPYKAWKKKAKYFNTNELYKVLIAYIKDENANWLGKTPAIKEILLHCPGKEKDLKKVVYGLKDSKASLIQEAYEKEIQNQ